MIGVGCSHLVLKKSKKGSKGQRGLRKVEEMTRETPKE